LDPGITIPDVTTRDELMAWARCVGPSVLPVGAAEFFAMLLTLRPPRPDKPASRQHLPVVPAPTLFVCGSVTAWRTSRRRDCLDRGVPFVVVGGEISPAAACERVGEELAAHGSCVLALEAEPGKLSVRQQLEPLVETASRLLESNPVTRICVEGGATAAALARRIGWMDLAVRGQCAAGVVSLDTSSAVELIVKPGSYAWPPCVWDVR
jgi:uncharacterized protein YgbK (DUF1537 family)